LGDDITDWLPAKHLAPYNCMEILAHASYHTVVCPYKYIIVLFYTQTQQYNTETIVGQPNQINIGEFLCKEE